MRGIASLLLAEWDAVLQSISYEDVLLYADFLPDAEDKEGRDILSLITEALETMVELEGDRREDSKVVSVAVPGSPGQLFLDLGECVQETGMR